MKYFCSVDFFDWTLLKTKNPSSENLQRALEREQIHIVIRQNKEGVIYGLTFIDPNSKYIFNGSDLGKEYGAKMMQQRCREKIVLEIPQKEKPGGQFHSAFQKKLTEDPAPNVKFANLDNKIIRELSDPTLTNDYLPIELKFPKRKRKRKRKSDQL
jgi:hypothetical protein